MLNMWSQYLSNASLTRVFFKPKTIFTSWPNHLESFSVDPHPPDFISKPQAIIQRAQPHLALISLEGCGRATFTNHLQQQRLPPPGSESSTNPSILAHFFLAAKTIFINSQSPSSTVADMLAPGSTSGQPRPAQTSPAPTLDPVLVSFLWLHILTPSFWRNFSLLTCPG